MDVHSDPAGVHFVGAFHNSAADEDDGGVATPDGFQSSPDEWQSMRSKKRGLADAATQRDSQATQVQSVVTEVQSLDTQAWKHGPSFVNATGSLSGDSDERRLDDVDEDETQIVMSLSQDREAMRQHHCIQEEKLETPPPPSPVGRQLPLPSNGDTRGSNTNSGDASDDDSDMSDDMLEQDGDVNCLSSIAKTFELSDAEPAQEKKKPAVNVYKPRMPFQLSPPASTRGDGYAEDDDSSGAETEVEEEPQTTQTTYSSKVDLGGVPPALNVLVNKGFLGKRSMSETSAGQSEEPAPKHQLLDRAASCSDVGASPERSKRARVSLGTTSSDGKPPLLRVKRQLLDTVEPSDQIDNKSKHGTESCSAPSSQDTNKATEVMEEETYHFSSAESAPSTPSKRKAPGVVAIDESTSAAPVKVATPKRATPKSSRKRRLSSQTSVDDTQVVEEELEIAASFTKTATKIQTQPPASDPSIRIMFTGLDGTIPMLRAKVKKIADACQEDDEIEKVTHLVAPKNQLKRTVKLLCGISRCDHIVDERWLDESARSGVGASETLHCLKDTNAEAKWGFSLYHTMYEVPKHERRELFRGLRFFITNNKSILPPVKDLVKIVECAGGEAVTKGAATGSDIVITSEAALALATTKKATVNASPARIYTSEIILSSILQQKIDYDAHQLTPANSTGAPSKPKTKRARR